MLTPDEKKRILDIHDSEEYPLGNFYFLKALNPISVIAYFYWWIVPFVTFCFLAYGKYSNYYINFKLTNFSKYLNGVIKPEIILMHDIYAVMSLILLLVFLISIKKTNNNETFKKNMIILNNWFKKNDHPFLNPNFAKKMYIFGFTWLLVVQIVFWIFYPLPEIRSIRLIIAENLFTHFLYLNLFLFSYLLMLSSLLTTYGVKKYGMR